MGIFSVGSSAPPVGLDIGTDHVRAAQVKPSGAGSLARQAYGAVAMPMGAVVEGEIVDVDAVSAAIRELWRRQPARQGRRDRRIEPEGRRPPHRPAVHGARRARGRDPVPGAGLHPDPGRGRDPRLPDHRRLHDADRRAHDGSAARRRAARHDRRRRRGGRGRGLKLQQIDVTVVRASCARCWATPPSVLPDEDEEAGEATGVIHISSGLTNIAVVEKGVPRFTRVSSLAGNEFTQAIANVLNLTFDEAEDIKIRVGLPDIDRRPRRSRPRTSTRRSRRSRRTRSSARSTSSSPRSAARSTTTSRRRRRSARIKRIC